MFQLLLLQQNSTMKGRVDKSKTRLEIEFEISDECQVKRICDVQSRPENQKVITNQAFTMWYHRTAILRMKAFRSLRW